MDRVWKYECKTLQQLVELMDGQNEEQDLPIADLPTMALLFDMARKAALVVFGQVTQGWVKQYLDDRLPLGALTELHRACRRGSVSFSRSHVAWLEHLQACKMTWGREAGHSGALPVWAELQRINKLAITFKVPTTPAELRELRESTTTKSRFKPQPKLS